MSYIAKWQFSFDGHTFKGGDAVPNEVAEACRTDVKLAEDFRETKATKVVSKTVTKSKGKK